MAAMVERDHPVVSSQVGDLVAPYTDRASETMCQNNRITVRRAEHLRVQPSAVGPSNCHSTAPRQHGGQRGRCPAQGSTAEYSSSFSSVRQRRRVMSFND